MSSKAARAKQFKDMLRSYVTWQETHPARQINTVYRAPRSAKLEYPHRDVRKRQTDNAHKPIATKQKGRPLGQPIYH